MRSFKTEGIVIKRRNFNEADRIITVFSKRNGKINIKASGVRKITSRRSPHLELLNYSIFSLHQGKNMPVLTEVESLENFALLKKDLKKMGLAYHICELIDGLCAENQENSHIFDLLQNTLRNLSKEEDLAGIIYKFEIQLLTLLGFHTPKTTTLRINTQGIIESILERKLKTRQMLHLFS
ncbi:MAG: DNA repair protein RecO [Patescibacteria group bacterium]